VVPSSPRLAQREPQLATDPIGAQDRLAMALSGIEADLVLIDCPPSLGLLTVNGLFAADRVAIVTEPAAWATDGVDQILRNVVRIAARRDGSPEVAGIVVNRLARTRDARYWYEQLLEAHAERVISPPIRHRAAVAEAAAQSLPLHALSRDGVAEALAEFDAVLDAIAPDRPVGVVDVTTREPIHGYL
jgi:chromosome partitioning protein